MRALLACGLGLLVASVATGADAKSEMAKLQGTWTFEKDGMKLEMKFEKSNFTLTFDGTKSYKGTFKIDPSKKPKHMDLTVTEGDKYLGMTARAIYAVDGDTFKWCANEPGKDDRASEIPDKEGDGKYFYVVFKKAKK
jgi:uncharacterized protein (TIGR03067 family)